MKISNTNFKTKVLTEFYNKTVEKNQPKSTNINVLLNRVKINKRKESRKKIYFSAAASTGLLLFGFVIFA
tara:strand:+ start:505 stop:714 length:210 start_codon:yes stop_codon:yes gene_type:complete